MSLLCGDCAFEIPPYASRCPHCGRPSLFPNVVAASKPEEQTALEQRYQSAIDLAQSRKTDSLLIGFETAINADSKAVINRSGEEVFRIASSDRQLYATFYNLVRANIRLPLHDGWDNLRIGADVALFPHYHEEIRFALLSLNGRGAEYYGLCHMILLTRMIEHRATVFEENSTAFVLKHKVVIGDKLKPGYRALWDQRGKLAAVKHLDDLSSSSSIGDFPKILLDDTVKGAERFLEVHIYGPLSVRSLEAVVIPKARRRGLNVRLTALRERLKNYGVSVVE